MTLEAFPSIYCRIPVPPYLSQLIIQIFLGFYENQRYPNSTTWRFLICYSTPSGTRTQTGLCQMVFKTISYTCSDKGVNKQLIICQLSTIFGEKQTCRLYIIIVLIYLQLRVMKYPQLYEYYHLTLRYMYYFHHSFQLSQICIYDLLKILVLQE